jgi:hypothetical protein
VALDFEEPEQQDDLARVHAFIKQYHVPYTYLIAGAPAEMWEKVPQAVNLNTWPATCSWAATAGQAHSHRLRVSRQRRVQCRTEAGIHLDHRAATEGKSRQSPQPVSSNARARRGGVHYLRISEPRHGVDFRVRPERKDVRAGHPLRRLLIDRDPVGEHQYPGNAAPPPSSACGFPA